MADIDSPLRYPGGKSLFYSYVKELIICNDLQNETYVEPFAGGAGLALKLLLNNDIKRIVINDFDPAIYSFWYSILYHADAFCNLIDDVTITREEWKRQHDIYMEHNLDDRLKLGFATFFLNRTNVSGVITGGIIGGQKQQGNYKIDARFNKKSLISKIRKVAERREQIVLLNQDAKELIKPQQLRKFYKIFLNLDPPYVKKGAQLYKNAFREADHRELFSLISHCKRNWIVTYDICPLIANLYHSYRSSYLDVTYSIQSNKKAQEYIFFSDNLALPDSIILRLS
jgi:DNA adenine methylase